MITSTPGHMPVIAFSDDADYNTLDAVLGRNWCVALQMKDGSQVQVKDAYISVATFERNGEYLDEIGGSTWNEEAQDWNGPEFYVPLDDVVQIIVL